MVQDNKHPIAEEAALAFQQLKADLPHLFLECNHLSACLPSVSHLTRFITGPDQGHLHSTRSYDLMNSIDRDESAGLAHPASQALLLGHNFELTNNEDDFSAWQPDPMAFASWSQKVISHKAKFRSACQVSDCFAVDLAHPAVAATVVQGLVT